MKSKVVKNVREMSTCGSWEQKIADNSGEMMYSIMVGMLWQKVTGLKERLDGQRMCASH